MTFERTENIVFLVTEPSGARVDEMRVFESELMAETHAEYLNLDRVEGFHFEVVPMSVLTAHEAPVRFSVASRASDHGLTYNPATGYTANQKFLARRFKENITSYPYVPRVMESALPDDHTEPASDVSVFGEKSIGCNKTYFFHGTDLARVVDGYQAHFAALLTTILHTNA